jgi:hypothetical protein
VIFLDGSTVLGTVPVDGQGKATFTTSSLTPGDHRITAVFQGGPGFSGSISRILTQKVQQVTQTSNPIAPAGGVKAGGGGAKNANSSLPVKTIGAALIGLLIFGSVSFVLIRRIQN